MRISQPLRALCFLSTESRVLVFMLIKSVKLGEIQIPGGTINNENEYKNLELSDSKNISLQKKKLLLDLIKKVN